MIPCRTFSIVAADPAAGECGVAVASKFLAAGAVVPWARGGVGAIATQSHANTRYGPAGLDLLGNGLAPQAVIDRLVGADAESGKRQVGIVDMRGVKPNSGYDGRNDRYLDLRVDDHPEPVDELERLAALWRLYFEKPSDDDLLVIDERLAHELRDGLRRLGYDPGPDGEGWGDRARRAFTTFSEMENLEDRLRPDGRTDRQVLAYVRKRLQTSQSPPPPGEGQGGGSA